VTGYLGKVDRIDAAHKRPIELAMLILMLMLMIVRERLVSWLQQEYVPIQV
jgi:hypothetical protein